MSNITAATIETIIQAYYNFYLYNSILISIIVLLFYTTVSKLPEEIEYIWSKRFSLPTWLYLFTRYGSFIRLILLLRINFLSTTGRLCDALEDAESSLALLLYIGVQGLLIARAYSICQGNKVIAAALFMGFIFDIILYLYRAIAFPSCPQSNYGAEDTLFELIGNIIIILTDIAISGVCVWKVWDTWKLKREARIQSGGLVSILLAQSITRCCFVVAFTVTYAVVSPFQNSSDSSAVQAFGLFQNALSAILVADFTLDLRRQNWVKIEASDISLPTLNFSNVLQHVHQSFLVEMATPEEGNPEERGDDENRDGVIGSAEDIQFAVAQDPNRSV